jgi:glycosyltransferase involved in cell wall biosynthesis
MRRCYVDCTNTLYTGLNTGIQRVVRHIITRCTADQDGPIEFVPMFASAGKFYHLDKTTRDPLVVTKALNTILGGVRNIVDRLFDSVVGDQTRWDAATTRASDRSLQWHAQTIQQSRKLVPFILKCAFFADKLFSEFRPVKFEQGDVLFLADVFWDTVLMDALKQHSHKDTIHLALVYDIFPVSHPRFVRKRNADGFIRHLPYLLGWADGILSISRSSLEEIRSYGSQSGYRPLYDYFYLGADFKDEISDPAVIRSSIRDIFGGGATFLMVGTIEPRKNHQHVLESFKRLWDKDVEARLCIVGKIGWKCEETLAGIYSSPHFGKRLFMINDATDAELNHCYAHAKAVIIASFAEGFGLPLVEALHYGKKVFASDIPVFREIGGDIPVYFSLDRPSDLVDKIIASKNASGTAGGSAYAALSWDASIADLFGKISLMAERIGPNKHHCRHAQGTDG